MVYEAKRTIVTNSKVLRDDELDAKSLSPVYTWCNDDRPCQMILAENVSPVLGPREENHIPRSRPVIVIILVDRHSVDITSAERGFRIAVRELPSRHIASLAIRQRLNTVDTRSS